MQLVATPDKLTARADQRLQACIHAVALAIFAKIDRTGLSFDCGIQHECTSTLNDDDAWKRTTERTLSVP